MFKKGDFIKVKPNTKLESGEIVNNWAGEVQEVYGEEKCCLVSLDSLTIDSLDDAYLRESIVEGEEPFEYVFEFDDIELSERRDTDEQVMEALDRLSSRMIALEEEFEERGEELKERWIEEFANSNYYERLDEIQKESAGFIVSTFMDYMDNYEYVQPEEWSPSNVRSVCLDIVPRKITAEIGTFENYGDVLIPFLEFLGHEKYISNAASLIREVERIKGQIPVEAKNPDNWGMAKSMMMSAQEQGVDMSNEKEIEKFMMLQQLQALQQLQEDQHPRATPPKQDPYKGIGRNQKITIKYKDGRILENIKFKKVESDLRNGICEIVKK
jgi:hypothetical protein